MCLPCFFYAELDRVIYSVLCIVVYIVMNRVR